MSIGPVTLGGSIQRSTDIGMIKQQEENKTVVDQQNIGHVLKSQEEKQQRQVTKSDKTQEHEKKYDAKEKGNQQYSKQQQRDRKKKESKDRVVVKASGHFDMKI